MQALLQQPDQRILSNTLPCPAARALLSLRLHKVSLASRFGALAPADGGVDSPMVSGITVYKLAWPRTAFFLASICHAITDPPVTKIRLWASFGV